MTAAVASAVTAVAFGTWAFAAIPNSSTGAISGCFNTTSGALRVIDAQAGKVCTSSEKRLDWNQKGPKGLVWRGNWSSGVPYNVDDAVHYDGSAYVARSKPPAGTAPTNASYWSLLAARGSAGPSTTGYHKRGEAQELPISPNGRFDHAPKVVVSINVPPGSYLITATVGVNVIDDRYWVECVLGARGYPDLHRLDIAGPAVSDFGHQNREYATLTGAARTLEAGAISVACRGNSPTQTGGHLYYPTISAVRVSSLG